MVIVFNTYSGDGCNVKIICGLGGAHSLVPLSGVTGISSESSGLTGQLFGNGNKACGASFSETNHSNSDALKLFLLYEANLKHRFK